MNEYVTSVFETIATILRRSVDRTVDAPEKVKTLLGHLEGMGRGEEESLNKLREFVDGMGDLPVVPISNMAVWAVNAALLYALNQTEQSTKCMRVVFAAAIDIARDKDGFAGGMRESAQLLEDLRQDNALLMARVGNA